MYLLEINLFPCTYCMESEAQESEESYILGSESVFCFYNDSLLLNFPWQTGPLVWTLLRMWQWLFFFALQIASQKTRNTKGMVSIGLRFPPSLCNPVLWSVQLSPIPCSPSCLAFCLSSTDGCCSVKKNVSWIQNQNSQFLLHVFSYWILWMLTSRFPPSKTAVVFLCSLVMNVQMQTPS